MILASHPVYPKTFLNAAELLISAKVDVNATSDPKSNQEFEQSGNTLTALDYALEKSGEPDGGTMGALLREHGGVEGRELVG
jgi:hypothetical protein